MCSVVSATIFTFISLSIYSLSKYFQMYTLTVVDITVIQTHINFKKNSEKLIIWFKR